MAVYELVVIERSYNVIGCGASFVRCLCPDSYETAQCCRNCSRSSLFLLCCDLAHVSHEFSLELQDAQVARCKMQDARCMTKCKMQDARCEMHDARCKMHEARCTRQDALDKDVDTLVARCIVYMVHDGARSLVSWTACLVFE